MKGVTAEDGIVIYPDLLSFSAACTAVWILIFADASRFPLAYFACIAACVLFCTIQACRYNREEGAGWRLSYSLHFLWWSRFWLSSSCA